MKPRVTLVAALSVGAQAFTTGRRPPGKTRLPAFRTALYSSSPSQAVVDADDVVTETLPEVEGAPQPSELPESPAQEAQLRFLEGQSVVALNMATIALALGFALYQLLHVDIDATVALFQYDDIMEASAFQTSLELFLRLPADALHSYEALVPTNPIFYKACTSGVAYTVGDFVSQIYQGRNLETLDLQRSARSGAAGFIGHGPLCHFWMIFMETYLDFDGAWWGTGVKVLADQTVWGVYLNAMYSFLIGALALRPPGEVWRDVKATSWPALRTSWRFWPFVHAISFSHAVPLDLKLLWVDVMEVVWVTLLSKVANDDKDQALALEAAVEKEIAAEESYETALAEVLEAEGEVPPSRSARDSWELVWRAAWPLFAMWPFLFGTYMVGLRLGLE